MEQIDGWSSSELELVDSCPVCGSDDRNVLHRDLEDGLYSVPGRWVLHECGGCGSGYLSPRPNRNSIGRAYEKYYTHSYVQMPSATPHEPFLRRVRNDYLNHKYGFSYQQTAFLGRYLVNALPWVRERADGSVRHLPVPKAGLKLLDYGCGNGDFIRSMASIGWDAKGYDPDPHAAALCNARGLRVTTDFNSLKDQMFDAITMNHSVEHLHDPVGTLGQLKALLNRGGTLSIATPNIESEGRRVFGRSWYALQPPAHIVLFTKRALCSSLHDLGFSDIHVFAAHYGARSIHKASEELMNRTCPRSLSYIQKIGLELGLLLAHFVPYYGSRFSEELVITAHNAHG
jgi:2-polyprenyl-3-methyl-5-hydroxy-6-metoxy-1,4-benzoquinol methylase/rRNA maturation protein Nop10